MTGFHEAWTRHPAALLAAMTLVVAFAFQGSRGLYESTEGRYAETALEMAQGNLLEPTLAGRPHWTKPPLAYWPIASGVALLGPNPWGARVGNALLFCLTVLAVAGCGAALWDRTTGLVAGLVYATSPFPVGAAWALSADTLLALLEITAVWAYLRARREPDAPGARGWVRAMWTAFGLAFLTKGPVGLLPLLAILASEASSRRRVRMLDPVGLGAFAAVAFTWFAAEAIRHPGLLAYWVRDEVVGRAVADRFHRNPQWWKPFALYLPALVAGQGAWLLFGLRAFRRERLLVPRALWARVRAGDHGSFLLLWLALPLAVLWVSSSRLTFYVLPLYAPIALAVARTAVTGASAAAGLGRAFSIAGRSALVLVLLKGGISYAAPPSPKDMEPLFASIRASAGPDAEVRAYGEEQLHGLQFRLGGKLRRVSRDGGEPWADERLDEALGAIRRGVGRVQVLVCRTADAPVLEDALARADLPARRATAPGRAVFVVTAGEPRVGVVR